MNELVKIQDHNGKRAVSGRELHAFLESKQDFSNWIKNRIQKYGLIENQDYQRFDNFIETGGRSIEYALTIEAAKELSMVEGNSKGKQARQYFIECEMLANTVQFYMEPEEMLLQSVQLMIDQKKRINKIERRIDAIEANSAIKPNYFAIIGYANLNGIHVGLNLASNLGKRAKSIFARNGFTIETYPDPRFGRVNLYPECVLEQVFIDFQLK